MKTITCATLAGLIATVAAYPVSDRLWARTCTPGALVCNGSTKFALCTAADSTPSWMSVSEGTQCVCSGSECTITASSDGSSGSPGSPGSDDVSPPTPTTPTTPTAPSPAADKSSSLAPTTSAAVAASAPPAPPASMSPALPSSRPSSPVAAQAQAPAPAPLRSSAPAPAPSPSPAPATGPAKSALSSNSETAHKGPVSYKLYLGDGSTSGGWPEESKWQSFDSMWSSNLATIQSSCAQYSQAENSDDETADLKSSIESVSESAGIDPRFVLAVVMQESKGCVRVWTTNYGVRNPGLMQSHDGSHSCFNVNPCPRDQIEGMIEDGTLGTSSGDGLKQLLSKAGSGAGQYYKSARMYNSGSIAASGDLQDGIATHCYSTDIANRLLGWTSASGTACKLDEK